MVASTRAAAGAVEVRLENLQRRYGPVTALNGLDLTIAPGEMVALLGPSGCGKTTALRLLAGLEEADGGRVVIDGKDVTGLSANKRNVGMVFQAYSLFPHMTARQNVAFGLFLRKVGETERRRRAGEMLDLVGLSHKSRMFPSELSGGEQQRTAIARALVGNPKILLCDEPTGNLDPSNTTEIMELLQRINLKGTTVVVATHNQSTVDRMRRRVVRLEHGRILHDDERGYYFRGLGQTAVLPG